MSRKTRGTKIKVEEVFEDSSEEKGSDSEPEEIKGEIFKPTQTQSQCVMIAPGFLPFPFIGGKLISFSPLNF